MSSIEEIELEHHRAQILHDMRALVEKYRAIFDWDVPGVNQAKADRLIVQALRDALDKVASDLPGTAAKS
ncbi:MAG: hypothetical protein B7X35_07930 [Halothiobacillus sp. 14-56-357]|jgi:hypothetical protein|uniref:hypothetical protein n=1 Tax=Halothiobacillus sp. 15-55-196 TaxID=1970382 RepID=UPI000BCA53CD|nr:hypothetical protein [Halothiobacillus sp. 15-55-196]OZB35775.1 MAG: hypothetical protein B7X44_08675 [Halothiobacillus sp. 15-55-196]OZB55904.1 MAG: hypothetical protein B7X35_07930 [Halothiobacillus sp. 14-56-357]OZB79035.1 MAG: hypothetical protein B7X29_02495 [Halothiobacillus sp. 13-55-115]